MFDKETFSEILTKIYKTYNNQRDFADAAEVNRAYLSQYMNQKLDNPPTPKILKKIANASHGITNYGKLMGICGYLDEDIEKELINKLKMLEIDLPDLQKAVTAFVENYVTLTDNHTVDIYEDENCVAYYAYELITNIYFKLKRKRICKLLNIPLDTEKEICSFNIPNSINKEADEYAWNEIQNIIENLNEEDIISNLTSEEKVSKYFSKLDDAYRYYMCPVYGQIPAGEPNWTEECIEGRLPIDPNMMNIVDPEECYFLRVNGESMNKIIANGAYALIRKQDYADDGDIVVAIVNGNNEATLKKFKRFNDQFVSFEPMSSDESFKPINVDLKTTRVIILGKYIGKFEMKN